jgi:probable rRNA maturation factor
MITVQITRHFQAVPAEPAKLRKLVRTICRRFGVARATVGISIVDDTEITALNRKFLQHRGTTDSLSFDLSEPAPPGQPRVFELIVNGALAVREAAQRGHGAEAELALYVTHGLLHNLGFDDATAAQARRMHRTEDEILQHLGYGLVYNEEAQAPQVPRGARSVPGQMGKD